MKVTIARQKWRERENFIIDRPTGYGEYVAVHFLSDVDDLSRKPSVKIKKGGFVVFAPQSKQLWRSTDSPLIHDWFHFTGNVEETMKKYGLCVDTFYLPEFKEEISGLIGKLEYSSSVADKSKEVIDNALIEAIFATVKLGLAATEINAGDTTAEKMTLLRQEMLSHPEVNSSVKELAARVNLSESHFFSLYKKMFSVSPKKDLAFARIDLASALLLMGKSVKETADATGFSSEYQFIRAFSATKGITPGKYKKHS